MNYAYDNATFWEDESSTSSEDSEETNKPYNNTYHVVKPPINNNVKEIEKKISLITLKNNTSKHNNIMKDKK